MFTSVDWTATYYQGCNHNCLVCWTQFMPGGPISHVPRLMQLDEHQVIKGKTGVCFLNSAHDTFAACIPEEWILALIRWIGRQPEGLIFYLQSQNVWRAQQFMPLLLRIKDKVIMGTTFQTDNEAIVRSMSNAPSIYSRYHAMLRFGAMGFRLRLSLEPLYRFDLDKLLAMVTGVAPELVEVGLDNYAHRHKIDIPQPRRGPYQVLHVRMQDHGIKVVEKDSIAKWRRTWK